LDYEFVPGTRIPWANREIRTNAHGFRGPDFAEAAATWPRIAVIGDSLAAGYGVAEAEAFPYRMATLMREQGLPGEVIGFGVPGYNIQRIATLLETKVLRFQPDAVVYAMCLNDARPELSLRNGLLVATGTVEVSPGRALPGRLPIPGKQWLGEHSVLYGIAMNGYDRLLQHLGVRAQPLPPLDALERLYSTGPEAERFRVLLTNMAGRIRSAGAMLLIVCFPLADQLEARDPRAQVVLSEFARSQRLEFIDLYPRFLANAQGRPSTLLDRDGLHPNARGHDVAARATLESLTPWIIGGKPASQADDSGQPGQP
jgi:lysophospholipase L1-like esterase